MKRKDLLSSAILLTIAAAYYFASTGISSSSLEDEVGPRGLPNVLTILLVAIALLIGARAMFAAPAALAAEAPSAREGEASWPRALGMLALVSLYLPLATVAGYFIALFLIIAGVALYERMKPSWQLFAVAAGGAGFFWLLFVELLGVRQPSGMLF